MMTTVKRKTENQDAVPPAPPSTPPVLTPLLKRPHSHSQPRTASLSQKSMMARAERLKAFHNDDLTRMIAEAAYYKSMKRGFAPGHELEDWTEAEREIMAMLFQ